MPGTYNKFKNPDRSSLSQLTLSNYLYIKSNMGTLENFDPTPAVSYWMNKKQRLPRCNEKAYQQEWYNDVFDQASKNINKNKKIQPIVEF